MNQEQAPKGGENNRQESNEDKLKMVDAKSSDAASENKREADRVMEASQAATPSHEIKTGDEDQDDRPPSLQGSPETLDENFSGSTNLTLDQLKKEGDTDS